jgi:hypothetical protein
MTALADPARVFAVAFLSPPHIRANAVKADNGENRPAIYSGIHPDRDSERIALKPSVFLS